MGHVPCAARSSAPGLAHSVSGRRPAPDRRRALQGESASTARAPQMAGSRLAGPSRANAEGELRPSARAASEFVECPCPVQSAQAPDLAGHHCCGCSGHWPSDGCVRRHRSRTSNPYRDLCPWPKVGNRTEGSQLAYARGKWLFVGRLFPARVPCCGRGASVETRPGDEPSVGPPSATAASSAELRARYRSGSGSLSQLISSDEKATGSSSCGKCPSPSNSRQR